MTRTARPVLALIFAAAVMLGMAPAAPSAPAAPAAQERTTVTSASQMLWAPVPSVCGHPAGRLSNGSLPGIAPNRGHVKIRVGTITLGNLVSGGGTGAVAAIDCNRGGVPWSQHIVVWDRYRNIIGHYDTAKVSSVNRTWITRIVLKNRRITAYMSGIGAGDEAACCYSRTARVRMSWSPTSRRVILRDRLVYYESSFARHIIAAVNSGNRSQALRYASSSTVDDLFALRRQVKTMSLGTCFGAYRSGSEFWDATPGERGCRVEVGYPYNGTTIGATHALQMTHPRSTSMGWRAVSLQYIFGS